MYGTPPCIPGLVQTNITNSAGEKWDLLDKDIEMEDSETENENRNRRTITGKKLEFPENRIGRTFLYNFQHLSWKPSKFQDMCRKL